VSLGSIQATVSTPRSAESAPVDGPAWAQACADALAEAGVEFVCYLPDGLTEHVHRALGPRVRTIRLNREEEGVGIAGGLWLGGKRACLLMQNTGLANCYNAILGIGVSMRIPLVFVVSLRGLLGEFNPGQIPVGVTTEAMLSAAGVPSFLPRTVSEVRTAVMGAVELAEAGQQPVCVLLATELTGGKREAKA
jgi:sulfopyruvate decarboxylase subunit alpha